MENSSQEEPHPHPDILTSTMEDPPNPEIPVRDEIAEILESVIEATEQLSVQVDKDKVKEESDKRSKESEEETEENKRFLSVLGTYLSLAVKEKDDKKHPLLLKDGDVSQFLVLALMNDSLRVVSAALDVFEVLCCSKCNHMPLQRLPYFLPTLEKIARNKRKYPIEIRRDALNMLRAVKNETKQPQPLGDQSMSRRNVENGMTRVHPEVPSKTATLTRVKQRGRETVLKIGHEALQLPQNRVMIERVLIKIKGIISLTFNLAKNYCIIRGKHNVGSEVFGIAVANLGLDVSLVFKNELQEDVCVPISSDGKQDISNDMPDYLPEDDKENSAVSDDAVCKKSSQMENSKDSSIFNSALNFVRSSFYW